MPPSLTTDTTDAPPRLDAVTTTEAAQILRTTRQTIHNWIKAGTIRGGRIGKKYFIPRREIDRLIREVEGRHGTR